VVAAARVMAYTRSSPTTAAANGSPLSQKVMELPGAGIGTAGAVAGSSVPARPAPTVTLATVGTEIGALSRKVNAMLARSGAPVKPGGGTTLMELLSAATTGL